MFRNAVRKRFQETDSRGFQENPPVWGKQPAPWKWEGWAGSPDLGGVRLSVFQLRGQGSVLRVQLGCQCTLMDWLRVSRLPPPFEAPWIRSSQGTHLDKGSICRNPMDLEL